MPSALLRHITNVVNNKGRNRAPCPCATTNAQDIQCRPKTGGAWVSIGMNTHSWSRAANANITVSITPMGGAAVSSTQMGPACP